MHLDQNYLRPISEIDFPKLFMIVDKKLNWKLNPKRLCRMAISFTE